MFINFKKGAMFGLDARIALAIFGALSVISGASLYSAIQNAEAVRMAATLSELEKAIEQYMLDTGSYLPEKQSNMNVLVAGNLYSNINGNSGWNGPYFGWKGTTDTIYIENLWTDVNSSYSIFRHRDESWGSDINLVSAKSCNSSDCMMYLHKAAAPATDLYNDLYRSYTLLEELVDNNDGPGVGRVRAKISSFDSYLSFYYRLLPEYIKLGS